MVEFAFVAPVVFLLLFSVIDFGLTLNDYQSVRQGAREGARLGVVNNASSCEPLGSPGAQIAACVRARTAGVGDVRVRVVAPATWSVGATLLVCAQVTATSTTGFTRPFLNGRILKAKISMRIEKKWPISAVNPTGVAASYNSDAPPSGGNWTWCT